MVNAASSGGGNGMSAVLKLCVVGDFYIKECLQALAGQPVPIEGVEIRAMDCEENLRLVVRGKTGNPSSVALAYFQSHPPIDELRKIAIKV